MSDCLIKVVHALIVIGQRLVQLLVDKEEGHLQLLTAGILKIVL